MSKKRRSRSLHILSYIGAYALALLGYRALQSPSSELAYLTKNNMQHTIVRTSSADLSHPSPFCRTEESPYSPPRYGIDGTLIYAFSSDSDSGIRFVHGETSFVCHAPFSTLFAVSPTDKEVLLYVCRENSSSFYAYDYEQRKPHLLFTNSFDCTFIRDYTYYPDGQRISLITDDLTQTKQYALTRSGDILSSTILPHTVIRHAWSSDENICVSLARDPQTGLRKICLEDRVRGSHHYLEPSGRESFFAWSPDGKQLAYEHDRNIYTRSYVRGKFSASEQIHIPFHSLPESLAWNSRSTDLFFAVHSSSDITSFYCVASPSSSFFDSPTEIFFHPDHFLRLRSHPRYLFSDSYVDRNFAAR